MTLVDFEDLDSGMMDVKDLLQYRVSWSLSQYNPKTRKWECIDDGYKMCHTKEEALQRIQTLRKMYDGFWIWVNDIIIEKVVDTLCGERYDRIISISGKFLNEVRYGTDQN